jgi:hypothetical protein
VFTGHGLDPDAVPLWFARVPRDGFALAAMGSYRGFADVAVETLRLLDPDAGDAAPAAPDRRGGGGGLASVGLRGRVGGRPAATGEPP